MFDWKEEVALYMQDTFLSLLTCADKDVVACAPFFLRSMALGGGLLG